MYATKNQFFSFSVLLAHLCFFDSYAVAQSEAATGVKARSPRTLEYNRDIRPILAENCFACHGADSAARKGDLRIDQREAAIKARAILPGKPKESSIVTRIFSSDVDEVMPPPTSHKKLTAEQKRILEQWIASGAEYQPLWSFIPPKRPTVPAVRNESWAKNPIDHFVLRNLERAGLTPAPESDRRTLARRLALDLTGLPPEPAEIEKFAADRSVGAYEKYVDSLLKSSAWGEHRARYWLDYARYADTHGIHFDNYREMWSYRDWVIEAFNENLPYDRFSIEQLAGDLLPNATLNQRIATGFNRCNITTNEGGAIDEEYIVLYARDRTETASAVFMGLTANCAVCHDHKYDPISAKEFYSLSAFFNNSTQRAMDGNIANTPPILPVPRSEDRVAMARLQTQLSTLQQSMGKVREQKSAEFTSWLATAKPSKVFASIPHKELVFHSLLADAGGDVLGGLVDGQIRPLIADKKTTAMKGHVATNAFVQKNDVRVEADEVGDFERTQPFSASAWIWLPRNNHQGAIVSRMAASPKNYTGWDLWIADNRVGSHIIHSWPSNGLKVMANDRLEPKRWYHVAITYDGSSKAAGLRIFIDGVERVDRQIENDSLSQSTRTEASLRIGGRSGGDTVDGVAIQDVRLYGVALPSTQIAAISGTTRAAWIAANPKLLADAENRKQMLAWWLDSIDPTWRKLQTELAELLKEDARLKVRATVAHVMAERPEPPSAYLLMRGEYDKRGEKVTPATPSSLPPMPRDFPKDRLGLAKWLFLPEHPLTARVAVNRCWQEVFGVGLVKSSGDFGASGELPIDQELLDWLAVDFRESGWDVKRLYKMMVTSQAYRQSAICGPSQLSIDPENRLLSRGPRFRMDAEMVRDYALSASGLLVRTIGGPSVRPYQPPGVWEAVAMPESNTRNYRSDAGAGLYRRSLYTFWKRSAPPAMMDVLNAPSRETCTVRRERTNTPLQALATLNDVQFVEAARRLAERTLAEGGPNDDSRTQFAALRALGRPLTAVELQIIKSSAQEFAAEYRKQPAEAEKVAAFGESKLLAKPNPVDLAVWTLVCNQLLNLDEALNK